MTRLRRCGHGPGTLSPGDRQAVTEFAAMLHARRNPAPWTGDGDIAVRIANRGLERGRPLPCWETDADLVALVLIHPDTEIPLTGTLSCARTRIHGAWATPYRLLTRALAGRDLPPGIDLST
ncbi:hypothetical protein [Streptomyces sp. NPDC095817]|uniref:hypothetical protein n=1 Tax=Streptomyces sp. NPDC095817 TaxID=3155082 RepID=UPI00331E5BD5